MISELESGSHHLSAEGRYLVDSTHLWLVVLNLKSLSFKSVALHLIVIVGAQCVNILLSSEFFKSLNTVMDREQFLDAVVVITDIVAVFKNSKSTIDLILKHFSF